MYFSAYVISAGVYEKHVKQVEMMPVHLLCSTSVNNSVWWTVRTVLHANRDRRPIYRHRMLVDSFAKTKRYEVRHSEGVYNLTIINTTVTDAGEYQCTEDEGYGAISSVFLNVVG
jgi:Immunoglobulin V-set domain